MLNYVKATAGGGGGGGGAAAVAVATASAGVCTGLLGTRHTHTHTAHNYTGYPVRKTFGEKRRKNSSHWFMCEMSST